MPYRLNGNEVTLDSEPKQINGSLYVPFREVLEGLGGSVEWDNDSKTARGRAGRWTATFRMGGTTADVNGQQVTFPAPAEVEDGTLWVPVEFFKSAYGYRTEVNGSTVSLAE